MKGELVVFLIKNKTSDCVYKKVPSVVFLRVSLTSFGSSLIEAY